MAKSGVSTSVTELPESRVLVQAEVAPEEIEKRVAQSAKALGRQLRVPGFRQGKVPPPIVIQRVGRDAVLDEAVRDNLPAWCGAAIDDARLVTIGEPELDLGSLPGEGEPLTFSIEIGVRPKATLGDYKGLEVPRGSGDVADDAIDAELDDLRERGGRLEAVDRAAAKGDFVVMDFFGTVDDVPFPGNEARDQMIELGSGRLVGTFEEQLEGHAAGDELTVAITFPDAERSGDEGEARGRGPEEMAGKEASFAVTIKEVKAKQLPELDEDFATEQGFDSIDELREDIRERLGESAKTQAEAQFREAALDAAVANATVELPDPLVDARARELWDQMMRSLSQQGIDRATYLQIAGRSEEEIVADAKPDAETQLRREAVLAAVVEAEAIDPSEADLLEALAEDAERAQAEATKLLERITSAGRLDGLKDDVAHTKAIDVLADSARPIPPPEN